MLQFFTFIGAIGLFIYGMKLMGEALQKIADDSLRNVHAAMSHNPFTGLCTGVMLAALVQSSTATTVMIMSFVNAALISLASSLPVIMGANIGATLTTWIISILGFRLSISAFIFPLIAIALPLFQSSNTKRNTWGGLCISVALLFLGLEILKDSFEAISQTTVPSFFQLISSWGYGSVLIFTLLGIFLTVIVRTSSATFVLALLMCINGWIPASLACAVILGSNVGACLIPLLAARNSNFFAKRAAMCNLLFNVFGCTLCLALFVPFCLLIDIICSTIGLEAGNINIYAPISLALFHTLFNIICVILFMPIRKVLLKLAKIIIPKQDDKEEAFKLQYLTNKGLLTTNGQMALLLARKETSRYANETYQMFELLTAIIYEPLGSEKQLNMHQQIAQMEADSDVAEVEIADFLNHMSHKTLSSDGELSSRNLYKMVDELESIADSIFHMSNTLKNKQEQRVFFNTEMNYDLRRMFSLTDTAMKHMSLVLEMDEIPSNALNKAYNYEDEINNYRNQLRNTMLDRIDLKEIEYEQNTYFMMLINECEKIGDHAINVIAAACE